MLKSGLLILSLTTGILCNIIFQCPEETTCLKNGQVISNSLNFLNKISAKQYLLITHLTVNHASLEKIDPKLKYLRNLEYLDLSHNNIQVSSLPSLPNLKTLNLANNSLKHLRFSELPNHIETLDVSNNLLSQIPKDWESLRSLKHLNIIKNPINCECPIVLAIMRIRSENVELTEPILCHTPKQFANKNINSTNCSINDIMMYDEPAIEGSGTSDIFEDEVTSIPHFVEEDRTYEENTIIDDKEENDNADSTVIEANANLALENEEQLLNVKEKENINVLEEEEGSGDEGSGFIDIDIPIIPACHINCSTPAPVGTYDEQGASELPNPVEQFQIVAEDIYDGIKGDEPSTTTAKSTTSSTTPKESLPVEISETFIKKEVELITSDKKDNFEESSPETKTGEKMAKATALNESSYAVYVVVAVGLLLAVVFLVCLIKSRKNKRNERREIPQGYEEEMKPLGKPSIQAVNERNGKTNHIPETVPLINGNGKTKDDPVLTAFTPLAHPEILPSEDGDEEPELRFKPELLTPTTERVTIRASEIPDSIPKTPLLVDRKKNSVGEIVSTVLPP